jgi:hypothetical protein
VSCGGENFVGGAYHGRQSERYCSGEEDRWNRRTRHINVRYQYVSEAVKEGSVALTYVLSEEQLTDGLTKSLRSEIFERRRGKVGALNETGN